jgi:hypothetical protein
MNERVEGVGMKLVVITGPHAVGKMTVGQELGKLTGLKLFHNHMTIDLVMQIFDYSHPKAWPLITKFRRDIFEAVATSDSPGLIFTYMWAFDQQADWDYVQEVSSLFEEAGAQVFYVELEADYALRLERNKTPNRLENKPTKRDLERSEGLFKKLEQKYRLNSLPGEVTFENYLRIDNTHLEPEAVAVRIYEWMMESDII